MTKKLSTPNNESHEFKSHFQLLKNYKKKKDFIKIYSLTIQLSELQKLKLICFFSQFC